MGLFGKRARTKGDRQSAASHSDEEHGSNRAGEPSPIKDYDKFDVKQLMVRLHGCTQAELTAIDEYERSHLNRVEVLNKLRYMRGAQPLPNYDDLTPEQIAEQLESADMPTIKAVRAYERKFAHRPEVVEFVAGLHRERLANTAEEARARLPGGRRKPRQAEVGVRWPGRRDGAEAGAAQAAPASAALRTAPGGGRS